MVAFVAERLNSLSWIAKNLKGRQQHKQSQRFQQKAAESVNGMSAAPSYIFPVLVRQDVPAGRMGQC